MLIFILSTEITFGKRTSCHRTNGVSDFRGPAAARIVDLFQFIIFIYCSSVHLFPGICATLK